MLACSRRIRTITCVVAVMFGALAPGSEAATWQVVNTPGQPSADALGAPDDIAVAPDGSIWVTSSSHNGLTRLDPDAASSGAAGSRIASGSLVRPGGLDVGADGTLYVSDSTSRILQLSASGTTLRTLGSAGSGPGQLLEPGGVAIAADGSIWVADTGNDRIVRFAADGTFAAAFGSTGTASGQFDAPLDVEVAPDGSIWVADTGNDRIQQFTGLGAFQRSVGSPGDGPGQFDEPARLAATGGEVLVADRRNSRVQRISSLGVVVGEFGAFGPDLGEVHQAGAVAVATDGTIWVGDRFGRRLVTFDAAGTPLQATSSGRGWSLSPGIVSLERAADDSWVAVDAAQHQVVRVSRDDRVLWSYGVEGSGPDELSAPAAATIAADGSLYVIDAGNHRVVHVAADGSKSLRTFGSQGTGPGQMLRPCSATTAPDATVLVLDCAANQVLRFSPTGTFIDRQLSAGLTFGRLSVPTDVDLAPDGHVWISEAGTQRVQRFTTAFESTGALNTDGMNSARLTDIATVDAAADGTLLVASPADRRIVRFSADDVVLEMLDGTGWAFRPDDAIAVGQDVLVANGATGFVERWGVDSTLPEARVDVSYAAGVATVKLLPVSADPTLAYSFDGGATFGPASSTSVRVAASSGTVRVAVLERNGNRWVHDVALDRTPPLLELGRSKPPALIGPKPVRIGVRVADSDSGLASVQAIFRGRSVTVTGGVLDMSRLPQGRGQVEIRALDHAANAASVRWDIVVDRTPPRLDVLPDHFIMRPTTTLTYRDTLSGPARSTVTVPVWRPGRQTVRVTLRDRAGNVVTQNVTLTRRLSLSQPQYNGPFVVLGADGESFKPDTSSIRDVFRYVGGSGVPYGWSDRTKPLVTEVQWRLQLFGFYPCERERSGILDWPTVRAIQAFQRDRGIPAIGTVGPRTRASLDAELLKHPVTARGRCGLRA